MIVTKEPSDISHFSTAPAGLAVEGLNLDLHDLNQEEKFMIDGTPHDVVRRKKQQGRLLVHATRLSSHGDSTAHRCLNLASAASCLAAATKATQKLLVAVGREVGGDQEAPRVTVLKSAEIECFRPLPINRNVWVAVQLISVKSKKHPGYRATVHIYDKKVPSAGLIVRGFFVRSPRPHCIVRARLVTIKHRRCETSAGRDLPRGGPFPNNCFNQTKETKMALVGCKNASEQLSERLKKEPITMEEARTQAKEINRRREKVEQEHRTRVTEEERKKGEDPAEWKTVWRREILALVEEATRSGRGCSRTLGDGYFGDDINEKIRWINEVLSEVGITHLNAKKGDRRQSSMYGDPMDFWKIKIAWKKSLIDHFRDD
ncbi:MAG: hypothetical protein A3D65_03065 [Candidatus Lloydbacteria bacterium RIFCSPHIGHO2_02_FULL_50_13]|uniref:Uncharacterized protein n=1 Tax=Candidatus Lloydbacteria bacterium RIFCSPHIGHO2_02_FULL_50_13 TaxID=1798661 RepID=A0A1G2D7R5_9BACT|nr:MAG: hypothetical protein A3D65_03065 [Candidatus Lloydbacteria bacterium RIFCSPHIGHO2_02_FULL_50_13]